MSNPDFVAPNYTTQDAATYKANIDASIAANGADVVNIGFSYSGGTFTIHDAQGTALAATNPGFVRFQDKATPGYYKYISVEANQNFIDDAGASEIINNLFGFTTAVAVDTDVTFYIYAVANDDMDTVQFMLSRDPWATNSPAVANIGAPDDAVADAIGDFWSLDNIDETVYDTNPCTRVGQIRMRMSASDDWTVQALDDAFDGIGIPPKETEEWEFISASTASASATVDMTLNDEFQDFKVVITTSIPATDNVGLILRVSDDGGSTFKAGVSDYAYGVTNIGLAEVNTDDQAHTEILLADTVAGYSQGNVASEAANGEVFIYNAFDSSQRTAVLLRMTHGYTNGTTPVYTNGTGHYATATITDAIRIMYGSGNIASGTFTLYGRKKLR